MATSTSSIDAGAPVALPCPCLPDDIVVDIFARLPAKSAARCRCLSRAWAATLSSDDFADRHHRLANCRHSPRVLFLHYSFHDGPQMCVWSQDCPNGASSRMDVPRSANHSTLGNTLRSAHQGRSAMGTFAGPVYPRQFPLLIVPSVCKIFRYAYTLLYGPVPSSEPTNQPCLVGQSSSAIVDEVKTVNGGALRLATLHCRGLVVLQDCCAEINYLCNPSTGQMATLPPDQKNDRRMWHDYALTGHYHSLGLGYDVHTKKHKVVRIDYRGCDVQGLPRSTGCEVYAVNSTGRWLPVRDKPPAWVKYNQPSVFVQGHVHWLARQKFNISDNNGPLDMSILSSLADHRFVTVAPPLGMDSESLYKHELTKLDGHLCLFSYKVSQSSCYDIWILPEHGARVWNLHCRIDMSKASPDITDRFVRCRFYPLAIINNGSSILLVQPRISFANNYSRLCAYDLLTDEIEDIFNGGNMVYDCIMSSIDATVYEESIIPFGRG
ncbi:hypothetical protein ACQ4PT_055532 [Festuca glaucescens]